MKIEKVFIRKVAPEISPPDLQLIVVLEGDRYEAIPIHLQQHAKSLAYNLLDLAERLIRRDNETEVKGD
jgi:hypothetical protein